MVASRAGVAYWGQRGVLRSLLQGCEFCLERRDFRLQLAELREQQANDRLGLRRLTCDQLFSHLQRHTEGVADFAKSENPNFRPDL